jgi:hypothetical protein
LHKQSTKLKGERIMAKKATPKKTTVRKAGAFVMSNGEWKGQ